MAQTISGQPVHCRGPSSLPVVLGLWWAAYRFFPRYFRSTEVPSANFINLPSTLVIFTIYICVE